MRKNIIAFLSRSHGINILNSLISSNDYNLIQLYTHKLNPKSQDPFRNQRDDFVAFQEICFQNEIPLLSVDNKNEKIKNCPECDYIVEVSWRYIIPQDIVKKAKFGAFGIHRGKLPDYAGAEPIKQALQNNEKNIVVSAHYLDTVIDYGKTIYSLSHPVNYDDKNSLENNIQRLRDEITPLFSKIMFKTFKILTKEVS